MAQEYRATLKALHNGQSHQNVLHFRADAETGPDSPTLASELALGWCTIWRTVLPANFVYQLINVKALGTTDPSFDFSVVIPGTGGPDQGTLTFVAMNCKIRTAFAGKHGRGRFYQAGLNPGHLFFGVIAPATVTGFQAVLNSLMARYGPTGSTEYQLGVRGRGASADFHPATSLTLDTIPRVQRRRNIGVGI